jgi:hypothetical protein
MRPSWTSGPATPPVVFALLVASLLFLGMTREVAAQTAPAGEAVIAWHVTIAPTWFDPSTAPAQITPFGILFALHDALVRPLPGKGKMSPSLAESWTESTDGLTYEFKLRRDLKFHNGDPITAEDVKFSYERYRGAGANLGLANALKSLGDLENDSGNPRGARDYFEQAIELAADLGRNDVEAHRQELPQLHERDPHALDQPADADPGRWTRRRPAHQPAQERPAEEPDQQRDEQDRASDLLEPCPHKPDDVSSDASPRQGQLSSVMRTRLAHARPSRTTAGPAMHGC